MIRYITNTKKDLVYSPHSESDMDDLITAGILSHHKAHCRMGSCFCKLKLQNLDDFFIIDYDIWNPEVDHQIPVRYSVESVDGGRKE
jgi:hypothetical protein